MEIMQAKLSADTADLGGRLMIAGEEIYRATAGGQHLGCFPQSPGELGEVPRADIGVGWRVKENTEAAEIGVDVRKDQNAHVGATHGALSIITMPDHEAKRIYKRN
jgi:hypothetical protein